MADSAPTLQDLETVVSDDPGPESVADALREAMSGAADAGGDDTAAEDAAAAARERDERGRFKAAEAAQGADPSADKGEPEEGAPQAAAGDEKDDTDDVIDPRPEWSLEDQNAFRALPPAAQKMVMAKIEAADKQASDVSQAGQKYQRLDGVLKENAEYLARRGLDEATAVKNLFVLAQAADKNPVAFIQWMAQDRGIDLARLVASTQGEGQSQDDAANENPVVRELRGQIGQLQGELRKVQGTFQSRAQQEQAQQRAHLDQQITTFAAATDDKGAAKHPYFESVRPLMASLISAGQAPDLSTAYDMACRAHPDVSAKIAAAEKAKAEREEARKRREKAAAAGNAGSSISGSPGGRSERQPTGDLREDLRAQFQERGLLATMI